MTRPDVEDAIRWFDARGWLLILMAGQIALLIGQLALVVILFA